MEFSAIIFIFQYLSTKALDSVLFPKSIEFKILNCIARSTIKVWNNNSLLELTFKEICNEAFAIGQRIRAAGEYVTPNLTPETLHEVLGYILQRSYTEQELAKWLSNINLEFSKHVEIQRFFYYQNQTKAYLYSMGLIPNTVNWIPLTGTTYEEREQYIDSHFSNVGSKLYIKPQDSGKYDLGNYPASEVDKWKFYIVNGHRLRPLHYHERSYINGTLSFYVMKPALIIINMKELNYFINGVPSAKGLPPSGKPKM